MAQGCRSTMFRWPPRSASPPFRRIGEIIDEARADVVVLARFMQIFHRGCAKNIPRKSSIFITVFCRRSLARTRIARPTSAALKYVGATCHYVTQKLDEGPIIEQDAFRTSHADSVEELIRTGRDVEKAVPGARPEISPGRPRAAELQQNHCLQLAAGIALTCLFIY